MVGKSLSHYQITAELGRGGMGIVYRAEDTKLDRTVAIKVLPSAALASEDDRARFYREAKAAAQLHHPHIASVFEIDEAVPEGSKDDDLRPFIAMEFIEGETLHDRIQNGPLKLEEAVRIASEIASALEAAHEKNIVHRDIKSANVMLTSKGSAKVLDFGLAQTAQSTKLTRMGSTLGTVAYMSPEQARGEEVDLRTDLWSLGAVLYEMIAGKSPFPGDYEQAVVYEILNQDPEPLTAVRTGVPMQLEWLVKKCLAKNSDQRYQTAIGLLVDLTAMNSSPELGVRPIPSGSVSDRSLNLSSSINDQPNVSRRLLTRSQLIVLIGLVIALTALATAYLTPTAVDDVSPGSKYLISNVSADGDQVSILSGHFAVSKDGRWLVFVAQSNGKTNLYKLLTGEYTPVKIPGTDDAQHPFFSFDERWVGFFANQSLKKVLLEGGSPEVVTSQTGSDAGQRAPDGGTWGSDGFIYFPLSGGIVRVEAAGGTPEVIVAPDSGSTESYHWPHFVSDENYLLVTVMNQPSTSRRIATLDLSNKRVQVILDEEGHGARNTNTGHIIFNREGSLMAAGFSVSDRKLLTVPFAIPGEFGLPNIDVGFGIAENGNLVTASIPKDSLNILTWIWVDKSGEEDPIFTIDTDENAYNIAFNRLSPAGDRISFSFENGEWIYDIGRSQPIPFDDLHGGDQTAWSPDGDYIAYGSDDGSGIYIKRSDFSEPRRHVYASNKFLFVTSWAPDGQVLAFYVITEDQGRDVWTFNLTDSVATPYLVTSDNERAPYFSFDGHWITYVSDNSGQDEVWVDRFPDKGSSVRVSLGGGSAPAWSPDGHFLYYRNGTRMMAAEITFDPTFRVVNTVELFNGPYNYEVNLTSYSIHPDGERFLMVRDPSLSTYNTLIVEEKWLEKLTSIQRSTN